jgi:iron complex transport system ATP-binding protein
VDLNSIEIKDLEFSFDKQSQVLKNISLDISKGKFYSILGPNGSGKTTLLKLISKLLSTDDHKVMIDNEDINSIKTKALSKKMAIVPQQTSVEFEFSALDIVMMGRAPHISRFSSESENDFSIVKKAMVLTNTWDLKNKSINALSGGERQRVIIARAIAQETDIVLLDEPISHLDIHHQIDLLNQMKTLNKKSGKTIVAVLHDLNLAAAFSDVIILMRNGKIHSIGKPEIVLNEETIEEVYGLKVHILKEPGNNRPYIIPVI